MGILDGLMEHEMNQTLVDIMTVVASNGIMSEETEEALIPEASLNFPATALTIFCHLLILFPAFIPDSLISQSVTTATHATTFLSLAPPAASIFDEARVGRLFMIARTPFEQSTNTELCRAGFQGMCNMINAFGVQLRPNIDILDAALR
jgi:hypothetical protein